MFVNKFCRFLNLIESCAYHQRRISEVVMQQISRDLRFPTATCAGVVATGRTGARLSAAIATVGEVTELHTSDQAAVIKGGRLPDVQLP